MIMSKEMRRTGLVARIGENRSACRLLEGNPERRENTKSKK
jgi:hypothetical protein